jgi:hypothetical protein
LREGFSQKHIATLVLTISILLTVGSIPNPVDQEIRNVQSNECIPVPSVRGRVAVGKVDAAMAITQGNTGKIPKDEHEAPFFVIYIPITALILLY